MLNSNKPKIGRLHVIINNDGGSRPTRSCAELTRLAIKGGADTIQYRNKSGLIQPMMKEALSVRSICREYGVTFIINDRVDLCLAVDADGVHLGQEDMPLPFARRILGTGKVIGATVREVTDLKQVEEESADYVGLGPIFKSQSKALTVEPLGLSRICSVSENAEKPVIAIGGITSERAGDVIGAGAYGIAVISTVEHASNPEKVTRSLSLSIQQRIPYSFAT
ncbi:MAG: thiamine phosphate synthase [Chlorobi bacterium]|nr:thiamine phosphate synthase [Chlorobiota bacterium]